MLATSASPAIYAIAGSLTGVALLFTLFVLFTGYRSKSLPLKSTNAMFCVCFAFFLVFRIACDGIRFDIASNPDGPLLEKTEWRRIESNYLLHRISYMSFFAAFSFVLYGWVHSIETINDLSRSMTNHLFKMFLVVNILLDLYVIIDSIVYLGTGKTRGGAFFQTSIMTIAIIDLVFVILFLIYGIRLYINVERVFHKHLYPVAILSGIFFSCFVVRTVVLINKRATGSKLISESSSSYIFTWLIPDLVPMICEVIVIYRGILQAQAKASAAKSTSPGSSTPSSPKPKHLIHDNSGSNISQEEGSHENQEDVGLLSGK